MEGSPLLLGASEGRDDAGSLIDALLGEQGDLSAVERFAQFHEDADEPLQGRFYSALLPATPPGPGQQLAFEVDLDRCSGCKACVAACHALNGLDEGEAWRDVGMIVGGAPGLPVLQHVTSSCHHCLEPACLNACPVDAYVKDPVTGIVRHLDDQCFGCQYCTLACPYDAPKFHAGKGIVRKCDMCSDRLRAGEAPACVQACPHEAIRIRVVDRAEVVARAEADDFLDAAPGPGYTLPTTRYHSARPLPGAVRPADHFRNHPEHAHWPLVIMLVLTQMAVGGFVVDLAGRLALGTGSAPLVVLSLAALLLGLVASTCHLGRPLYAYRALIGLRHSWLSREVAAFGLFAKLAMAHAALTVLLPGWYGAHRGIQAGLAAAVAAAGVAGLFCSVMVYHVVRRPFWRASIGGVKFAGTALVLGLSAALLCSDVAAALGLAPDGAALVGRDRALGLGLLAATLAKLAFEAALLIHLRDNRLTPMRRSALLVRGPLAQPSLFRLMLGISGGVALPLLLLVDGGATSPALRSAFAAAALIALFGGEIAERFLFFAAVVRPKMPGGVLS
jgi:Fe-S-cluster-containing dehydrogenase component/DMSO reductase anchor subunit